MRGVLGPRSESCLHIYEHYQRQLLYNPRPRQLLLLQGQDHFNHERRRKSTIHAIGRLASTSTTQQNTTSMRTMPSAQSSLRPPNASMPKMHANKGSITMHLSPRLALLTTSNEKSKASIKSSSSEQWPSNASLRPSCRRLKGQSQQPSESRTDRSVAVQRSGCVPGLDELFRCLSGESK